MLKYIVKQKEKAIIRLKNQIGIAGNSVYRSADRFFSIGSETNPLLMQEDPVKEALNYREWDLNQGMIDILLKDLRHLTAWLIPVAIKDYLGHVFRKLVFYFLYDALVEENPSEFGFAGYIPEVARFWPDAKIIHLERFPAMKTNQGSISMRKLHSRIFSKFSRETRIKINRSHASFLHFIFLIKLYLVGFHYNIFYRLSYFKLHPSFSFHKRN